MGTIISKWCKDIVPTIIAIVLIVIAYQIVVTPDIIYEDEQAIHELYDGRIVFPPGILAGDAISYLKALQDERNYHIIIDSFGGSAYDTIAIINRIAELQDKGFVITTEAYGYTLSGGALIFIMGDIRIIHSGATLMFHGAGFSGPYGNRKSLRDYVLKGKTDLALAVVESLAILDNKFALELQERIGFSKDEIIRWLYALDYNYMSSAEALKLHVATEER